MTGPSAQWMSELVATVVETRKWWSRVRLDCENTGKPGDGRVDGAASPDG